MPRAKKELKVSLEEATKLKNEAEFEKELDNLYEETLKGANKFYVALTAFMDAGFSREEAFSLLEHSMKQCGR